MTSDASPIRKWRILARIVLAVAIGATALFALAPTPPAILGVDSDPTKHVIGLAVLAIISTAAFPRAEIKWLIVWLAIGSLAIEGLQGLPMFGRDPDPLDWLTGMLGVFGAFIPIAVVRSWNGRKSERLERS